MMITAQDAIHRGYGDWRSFTCPVHDDHNPSARLHVVTGFWKCMSCGAKGRYSGKEYEIPERIIFEAVEKLGVTSDAGFLPDSIMSLYEIPGEYWITRFSESACVEWELGTDTNDGLPIYSARDTLGRLLGIVKRVDDGKKKYKYSYGFKAANHIYGGHKIQSRLPIVIVEGAPGVVALWESGVQAVGIYGSHLHQKQIEEISSFEPPIVITALDNDRAGDIGTKNAIRDLGRNGVMAVKATWDDRFNDVEELSVESRRDVFDNIAY